MPQEIERKFLVLDDSYKKGAFKKVRYRQGYLASRPKTTVRIRVAGEEAFITVKGPTKGITRLEFEYPIPLEHGETMLNTLCGQPLIEKDRYTVIYQGHEWVVDEFFGANGGLVVAEIELDSESSEFSHPEWLGKEVSDDPRYHNSKLQKHPYSDW
jgi:adenylate cyclase